MSSVDPDSVYVSPDELVQRITDRANWICMVDAGRGVCGTGLLVGPDLVLTNYHVIEALLLSGEVGIGRCRFDFRTDPETEEVGAGRWVDFAAADWLPAKSAYSDLDRQGARTGFAGDELDYAIVRLAEPVGGQPLADGDDAVGRGWLPIPDRTEMPSKSATVHVFQHPLKHRDGLGSGEDVMPQKSTQGNVIEYLDLDLRMRHTATTYRGSSGAPCFDGRYRLVALHHAGDKTSDIADYGEWNQAIPIPAIVRHLRACGNEKLIGIPRPLRGRRSARLPAASTASLGEDDIDRRLLAAAVLMDRDGVEEKVAWARHNRGGNRGIVHVVTCRHVDRHQYFFKRLSVLTLDDPDVKRKRLMAFLGEGCNDYPWRQEPVVWHPDQPEEIALDLVRDRLSAISRMPGRTIALATVAVDQAKVVIARERRFVRAVAEHCMAVSDADRLQLFVVYHDAVARPGADKTLERRKELGRLWDLRERPPGCGVCTTLDDVDSLELASWSEAIQSAWKLADGRVLPVVEAVFTEQSRRPILEVENGIRPGLRQLIAAERQ